MQMKALWVQVIKGKYGEGGMELLYPEGGLWGGNVERFKEVWAFG